MQLKIKASALPCRAPGADPDDWFGGSESRKTARAKAACRACPLYLQCRMVALEEGIPYGVWGGLDGDERAYVWSREVKRYPMGRPDEFHQITDSQVRPLLQGRRDDEPAAFMFGAKTSAA